MIIEKYKAKKKKSLITNKGTRAPTPPSENW